MTMMEYQWVALLLPLLTTSQSSMGTRIRLLHPKVVLQIYKKKVLNQLSVFDVYTRHKYMEVAIVSTADWLKYCWIYRY